MDYFFWDEIFGGRPNLGDLFCEGHEPAEDKEADQVSVIIAYVETFQGPQNG